MDNKVEILNNPEAIRQIDREGMLEVAAKLPDMIVDALSFSLLGSLGKIDKLRQIVVAGMGGSAIAGNIIADAISARSRLPIHVSRHYHLPAFVDAETLFFALSYSGNTEETISAVKEAGKRGAKIICVTSGGKLRELAENNNYPYFLIPTGYQPRAALPYLLIPIIKVLEEKGLAAGLREEVNEAVALLKKLEIDYAVDKQLRNNPVKQLAKKLIGKTPVIFASSGTTEAAGLRLKTQFNENSKVTALFNVFPELDHNEIVNLSVLKREEHNFALVILRDDGDAERIKKRIEITKSLLVKQLGGANEIAAQGKSVLARILSLIYFGDFLSVYLAVARGLDPTPVEIIARLKKELAR
ncbi:MAG: bifunctional phosphoglucose/phosphomannose isomerase [Candidatus Margulisbacteria bacterium]|nr:bifunctional phosphoglucose/phosphomannose isomerase [Candidatus Margulisiibacteriota bacterium]